MNKKSVVGAALLAMFFANDISAANFLSLDNENIVAVCDNVKQYKTIDRVKKPGCLSRIL